MLVDFVDRLYGRFLTSITLPRWSKTNRWSTMMTSRKLPKNLRWSAGEMLYLPCHSIGRPVLNSDFSSAYYIIAARMVYDLWLLESRRKYLALWDVARAVDFLTRSFMHAYKFERVMFWSLFYMYITINIKVEELFMFKHLFIVVLFSHFYHTGSFSNRPYSRNFWPTIRTGESPSCSFSTTSCVKFGCIRLASDSHCMTSPVSDTSEKVYATFHFWIWDHRWKMFWTWQPVGPSHKGSKASKSLTRSVDATIDCKPKCSFGLQW